MDSIKANIKFDLTEFEKRCDEVATELSSETFDILKYCAQVFANAAARYTPPNIGKNSIEKKFYERPFLLLGRLIRGGYKTFQPTEEDLIQFRNGMKFKVIIKHPQKPVEFAYCKTKGQLKKLRRIANRGLAKVMWGKDLNSVGAKIPPSIQRLMNKSPNLKDLPYNLVKMEKSGDSSSISIENRAIGIEKFGKGAEAKGYEKVKVGLSRKLKEIANKDRNL